MPRFEPPPTSRSTGPVYLQFDVPPEDWEAEFLEAQAHTREAIEFYSEDRRVLKELKKGTIDKNARYLERFFGEPVVEDALLGRFRPLTLPELLGLGGRQLIQHMARELRELHGEAAYDLLAAVRSFGAFIERYSVLPSGVNLRKRWGALVCPIGERDVPRRAPKSEVFLPRIESMPTIFDAIADWAEEQDRKWHAWRSAVLMILCFEAGLRGIEARRLNFADHLFDRALGVAGLGNPLSVRSAKNQPVRRALVEEWGWIMLQYWLKEWRPQRAEPLAGHFFPSSQGNVLASSSQSETTGRLIRHLKESELLHEEFTFHATRKTYATHFLERNGTDVDLLLQQCGWTSPVQLGTYVRPSVDAVARQRAQFARTQGLRTAGR